MKIILPSLLLCAILSACRPSPAELDATAAQEAANQSATQTAQAPTSTATYTPSPTFTLTPIPTNTPLPTATDTPSPTKDPLAGEFRDGKLVMTDTSFRTLTDLGQSWYADGLYLAEMALYSAMLDYALEPDQVAYILNLQAEDYEALGHYDLAIANYLQAVDSGIVKPTTLNGLCWDYALTNDAEAALPYCEEAVKQDPSSAHLDSRGLVYALLGKYPEALSDFEAALELDDFPNDEMKAQRQEWVSSLQAGNNPITEQVLASQRAEESSLDTDPQYTGELKLSYIRQQYEELGYTFKPDTISGEEVQVASLQSGDCKNEIILIGNEQEFKGAVSAITDCSHNNFSSHAGELTFAFARDLNEMARALVWQSADWYYVIEGKPVTDLTPKFGGFEFSVERQPESHGIYVFARPGD